MTGQEEAAKAAELGVEAGVDASPSTGAAQDPSAAAPPDSFPQLMTRITDLIEIKPGSVNLVTISVQEPGKQKRSFHVPVDILAKHSPVFAAMFQSGFAESLTKEACITQFSSDSVCDFLELLLIMELNRSSTAEITLSRAGLCNRIKSAAPLVRYYQCSAAEDFLAAEIEARGDLECLAAFEEVFCDGNEREWSASLYEKIASEGICLSYYSGHEREATVWVKYDVPQDGSGCLFRHSHIGWLCKSSIARGAEPYLKKLRSCTLLKLMAVVLAARFTVDGQCIAKSAFEGIRER